MKRENVDDGLVVPYFKRARDVDWPPGVAYKMIFEVEHNYQRYRGASYGDEGPPAEVAVDIVDDLIIYLHRRRFGMMKVALPLRAMIVLLLPQLSHGSQCQFLPRVAELTTLYEFGKIKLSLPVRLLRKPRWNLSGRRSCFQLLRSQPIMH